MRETLRRFGAWITGAQPTPASKPITSDPRLSGLPWTPGTLPPAASLGSAFARQLAGAPGARMDAWQNSSTGLGTDRDKMQQGSYFAPFRIMDTELLALYNGSDIAARICETPPREMLRRGYTVKVEGASDPEEERDSSDSAEDEDNVQQLVKQGEKLRAKELLTDAGVWGRLFGGALLIIGAEDGQPMEDPLDEKNIRSVRYLNVIDRRFIFVYNYYADPLSPNYGLPERYLITTTVGGSTASPHVLVVHESRCLRFDGARTDILTRLQLAGWSWSVLQRPYEVMRAFENGFQAVANLMSDASQAVFKIENLISMLASGEKDTLQTRMALVDQSRSVCRAVLLDAEKEDFARQPTTFSGLPDLLDRFMMRLSAACEIPVTILLGRSAAGMNATGDADFRAFYDGLESQQENDLAPKLQRLYHIMAAAKDSPFEGQLLEFTIEFAPLWAPTDTEQADVEYKTAQKDQIYATIGAATPEEIAMSRWGKGKFVPVGMSAFSTQDAAARQQNEKMFGSMLQPPPELQGKGSAGQGEQQTSVAPLPGPTGTNLANAPNPFPGAPIGAGASPYGQGHNPVRVVAKLHEEPKPPKPGAPR